MHRQSRIQFYYITLAKIMYVATAAVILVVNLIPALILEAFPEFPQRLQTHKRMTFLKTFF